MNPRTRRFTVQGPAGDIDCALDEPDGVAPAGLVVICHPHPQHGGTMDNKVVQTLARSWLQRGWRTVRFNFRGVGGSQGQWDDGRGEIDDACAVVSASRQSGETLVLGGFSFGAYVATHVAARQPEDARASHLVLVGPAVQNFQPAPVDVARTSVIHGEHDEVVPLSAVLDWARPQVLPVTVVPGVGHFFHGQLGTLKQIVLTCCHP